MLAAVFFWRFYPAVTAVDLAASLPANNAVVLFIDVKALREARILDALAGPRVAEEPEYRAFVSVSGFDYRTDLDAVIVSFAGDDVYISASGRFDWKALKDFTLAQKGHCQNGVCQMPASRPNRVISYRPRKSNLIAMAVSTDAWAVMNIGRPETPPAPQIPAQPVWVTLPSAILKNSDSLPAGTRLFAKALESTDRVTISLDRSGERIQALLEVSCRNAEDAAALVRQLRGVTEVMRKYLERVDQKPNPADLSGAVVAGEFEQRDKRVIGRWPVEKALLDSIAGGTI